MILILLFLSACMLAYSNVANNNFKGIVTLFGSGTTNYKMIGKVLLSWLLTLPIAAIISGLFFKLLETLS